MTTASPCTIGTTTCPTCDAIRQRIIAFGELAKSNRAECDLYGAFLDLQEAYDAHWPDECDADVVEYEE